MMLDGACHCGNLSFEFEADRSVFAARSIRLRGIVGKFKVGGSRRGTFAAHL